MAELRRREALGGLLLLVLQACDGGGKSTASSGSGGSRGSGGATPATTSPASASSATSTAATAAASSTPTTSPPTSPPPPTSTPTTAAVVPGSNKNLTREILADDARGYNGSWVATWRLDPFGTAGSFSGVSTIDPDARTLKARLTIGGDLLHDGVTIPPIEVDGSVDSYTYDDNGTFRIDKTLPVGQATISSGRGIGSGEFTLTITDLPDHPSVSRFEATGVANRGGEIPITFVITFADGSEAQGSARFTKPAA